MDTSKKTQRRLTGDESFRFFTWYKEHQDRLLQFTDSEICREAGEVLKIEGLNISHIFRAREVLGLRKRVTNAPKKSEDVETLTCLLNEQADTLEMLKRAYQGLLDRVRKLETTR